MTESFKQTPNEKKKKHAPYDLLYDGINLAEKIGIKGYRLLIPRAYLFGTQELTEYSQAKRKQILAEFEKDQDQYMHNNPVIVLANSFENGIQLIIIDGHHRVRYAPKFGINNIPCLIVDPKTLISIINSEKGTSMSTEEFTSRIEQNVADALNSFDQKIVNYKSPQFVFNTDNISELAKRFPPF
jgi:hypothetical protein